MTTLRALGLLWPRELALERLTCSFKMEYYRVLMHVLIPANSIKERYEFKFDLVRSVLVVDGDSVTVEFNDWH